MQRSVITRSLALLHKLHRWTGTVLALLMAVWFASGAVMTFAYYPAYTDAERLALDPPLTAADAAVPPALLAWLRAGGLAGGGQARLAMLEGEPRWLVQSGERYEALRTAAPFEVTPLDEGRATAEARRTHAACVGEVSLVDQPDQWTVGRSHPGSYPLQRIFCGGEDSMELYVSTRSGEVVQESTRSERVLAWLGPIPHWIYPAVLRRERVLWRDVVLWLSAFGCVVTVTGMIAGVDSWRRRRRSSSRALQQVYLRWHQRLGLGFGLFASTWLFSGALSLEPFHWASSDTDAAISASWSRVGVSAQLESQLRAALASCSTQLPELRELELVALGKLYAVCSDRRGQSRIVDLEDPELTPRPRLAQRPLLQLTAALPGTAAQLTVTDAPDDYYYPTHRQPIAQPYARYTLHDAAETVLYFDPARGQLVQHMDKNKRLERWLYHGLHSWDFPVLYTHRTLWRSLIITAMCVGAALVTLGALIFLRRQRRLSAHRERVARNTNGASESQRRQRVR